MSERTLALLPVREVTCLEDRAQVERAGRFDVPAGVSRFRVEGVSVLAAERTLRVACEGARVVDVKLVRQWREKPKGGLGEDATELQRRVHALGLELAAVRDDLLRAQARQAVCAHARGDFLRAVAEQTGAGQAAPDIWGGQMETLAIAEARILEDLRLGSRREDKTKRALEEARAALAATQQPERAMVGFLDLTLEGQGGPATVHARYLVPCAAWRPAYRATLRGNKSVLVECEAVVWQRTGEEWPGVALRFSTERPALGARPPALSEDHLRSRPKQEREKRVVEVAVRQEAIATTGEGGARRTELPGVDDGGVAQRLEAPSPASVPCDGQPHRVPLSSFEAPAKTERLAVPELLPLVSLVARFPNKGRHVLMAGPVDLVRGSGFVGRGQMKFAGLGETVALSFGTDDDLRITRNVAEISEEASLTGRRTTTKRVFLFVSNAGPEPAPLVIEERLPVSEVKEVQVEVLTKQCSPPASSVSAEGIARFEIDLAAHGQQTLKFTWQISSASKVAGL